MAQQLSHGFLDQACTCGVEIASIRRLVERLVNEVSLLAAEIAKLRAKEE